jgi:putative redox protein
MVEIAIAYQGELHCEATHGPSSKKLETDAPVDNHGRGETYSPTDLVATGLGTCMATVMGIRARAKGYLLTGMGVRVKKIMTPTLPRRIARLETNVDIPNSVASNIDAAERAELENIARNCPVRLSLLDAIEVPLEFHWR